MTIIDEMSRAQVFDLEQPRFAGMPIHPAHKPGYFYALHRRHRDTYRPKKHGPRSGASGVLTMMEHSGTHIDALCHQACDLQFYKGVAVEDVERTDGFTAYGAETMAPLLARGVLLVRTGFATRWTEEEVYLNAAGVSKSGNIWAADRQVQAVGADNMAWDCMQERDPETNMLLFGHAHLLVKHGIHIIENLNLEALAAAGHREFCFVGIPLKLKGATGSPIRPLALVS